MLTALTELLRWPSALERRIARRYLQGRRRSRWASLQAVIATGGVAIGVMALVVVLGVMNGLRDELRDRILVASPHLRILTYGNGLKVDDWQHVIDVARRDPAVVAAAPEVLSESIASAGADYVATVHVVGLEPDSGNGQSVNSLSQSVVAGDLRFHSTAAGVDAAIVLGRRLATRLNVGVGDVIQLVPPSAAKINPALGIRVPQFWRFEITGIFDTGMYQYDDGFVVMSLVAAQRFTGLGAAVSAVDLRLVDPWQAPVVGARLVDSLGYPYRSLDWQAQNANLFGALQLEKLAMGFVIFFIMIVAAFNIVGTLTMVATDKTREIGILQAMGLRRGAVGRIFLAQGAAVGAIGVVIGLAGGLLVAAAVDRWRLIHINPAVYFIDHLPVRVEPLDVVIVVVVSLALAIGATIYPASAAARLAPADAIRHE